RRQLVAKGAPKREPEAAEARVPGAEGQVPGAKGRRGPGAPAPGPGFRPPYSDEVIRSNTGRTWDEWFALLDAWGAVERPHPEIARWVNEEHGVPGWWAQGVTVAYEQARGLRAPRQRRGGQFEGNATRTGAGPAERLYEAVAAPAVRERWLPGATVGVRTARPARSIRANWDDGSTRLVIAFTARGEAKSQGALTPERAP